MTKKRIREIPSLETLAFLFPKKEFIDTVYENLRFRAYFKRGRVAVDWRRTGESTWGPTGPDMVKHIQTTQRNDPGRYIFLLPVEIDDE